MEWLTESDQPAVRYLAMRDLLDTSEDDLRKVRKAIPSRGWVKQIHRKRLPGGYWVNNEDLYRPKYFSTNWMLLTLSDLGVTRELPWLAESAEMWRDTYARPDGGFDSPGAKASELCLVETRPGPLSSSATSMTPRSKAHSDGSSGTRSPMAAGTAGGRTA